MSDPKIVPVVRCVRVLRAAALLVSVLCAACASPTGPTKDEKRADIDKLAEDSLAQLYEEKPEAKAELEKAPGYGVFRKSTTKVPLIGAGGGYGIIVDNTTKERTYMKIREMQIGAGLGVKVNRTVVVFHDKKLMDHVLTGKWRFGAAAGAAAGDKDAGGGTAGGSDEFTMYAFADKGVAATATLNLLRVTRNRSLNKK